MALFLLILLLHWLELNNWLVWTICFHFISVGEDKYPHMLMVIGLMEKIFDGAKLEKKKRSQT